MSARFAGAAVGLVFGFMLSWSRMVDPDVIRDALLFRESYLFLFMGSAVATAAVGQLLLRRRLTWPRGRVERRHITGALVFGVGWGLADACPGPIAAQTGQGIGWALFTATGVVIGVFVYLRRNELETEPAREPLSGAPARPDRSPAPARTSATIHPRRQRP